MLIVKYSTLILTLAIIGLVFSAPSYAAQGSIASTNHSRVNASSKTSKLMQASAKDDDESGDEDDSDEGENED